MRTVDLAIYARHARRRARRARRAAGTGAARLREAAIERDARAHLAAETVRELESLGILGGIDERTARSEIHRLGPRLEAVEQLQSWVESRLELSAA